ncbi:SRPBCC family protein [Agromyces sp. NPDC057679]|uniref:SRPBCC family protein n=1 Tax=Agromyces sp. NPDC057679 TaxID=3346207 RepID=UPI00366D2DC2
MIHNETTRDIDRSAHEVFDFIAVNVFENHPKWEREVLEVRRTTPGPVRVGSRGVMVRQDGRRRSEVEYECTEFEPDVSVGFRQLDGPFDFAIRETLESIDARASRLHIDVRVQPHGWLRLFEPLMRRDRRGERIADDLVAAVEAVPRLADAEPVTDGGD